MTYDLRLTYPSGAVHTLRFATRFLRALMVISLANQAVDLTLDGEES